MSRRSAVVGGLSIRGLTERVTDSLNSHPQQRDPFSGRLCGLPARKREPQTTLQATRHTRLHSPQTPPQKHQAEKQVRLGGDDDKLSPQENFDSAGGHWRVS